MFGALLIEFSDSTSQIVLMNGDVSHFVISEYHIVFVAWENII
jgi:hypothetical protein